jgi:hypothetical protein
MNNIRRTENNTIDTTSKWGHWRCSKAGLGIANWNVTENLNYSSDAMDEMKVT